MTKHEIPDYMICKKCGKEAFMLLSYVCKSCLEKSRSPKAVIYDIHFGCKECKDDYMYILLNTFNKTCLLAVKNCEFLAVDEYLKFMKRHPNIKTWFEINKKDLKRYIIEHFGFGYIKLPKNVQYHKPPYDLTMGMSEEFAEFEFALYNPDIRLPEFVEWCGFDEFYGFSYEIVRVKKGETFDPSKWEDWIETEQRDIAIEKIKKGEEYLLDYTGKYKDIVSYTFL